MKDMSEMMDGLDNRITTLEKEVRFFGKSVQANTVLQIAQDVEMEHGGKDDDLKEDGDPKDDGVDEDGGPKEEDVENDGGVKDDVNEKDGGAKDIEVGKDDDPQLDKECNEMDGSMMAEIDESERDEISEMTAKGKEAEIAEMTAKAKEVKMAENAKKKESGDVQPKKEMKRYKRQRICGAKERCPSSNKPKVNIRSPIQTRSKEKKGVAK
ncbi:hypothetical protein N665_0346s0004 [Sinapis alba]|nr:hypothetical protein N665_0346s0004 [Sinapis alba]